MNWSRLGKLLRNASTDARRSLYRPVSSRRQVGRGFEIMENRLLLSATATEAVGAATLAASTEGGYVNLNQPGVYAKPGTQFSSGGHASFLGGLTGTSRSMTFDVDNLNPLTNSRPHASHIPSLILLPTLTSNSHDEGTNESTLEGGFIAMAFSSSDPLQHDSVHAAGVQAIVQQTGEPLEPHVKQVAPWEPSDRLEASRGQSQAFDVASFDLRFQLPATSLDINQVVVAGEPLSPVGQRISGRPSHWP